MQPVCSFLGQKKTRTRPGQDQDIPAHLALQQAPFFRSPFLPYSVQTHIRYRFTEHVPHRPPSEVSEHIRHGLTEHVRHTPPSEVSEHNYLEHTVSKLLDLVRVKR